MESPAGKSFALGLIKAAKTYRAMLDMGLLPQHALQAVESITPLTSIERQLLLRCISSRLESEDNFKKIVDLREAYGKSLAIDLFNVAITIAEAFEGYPIFRCTDGLTRDLAASYGRSKKDPSSLMEAVKAVAETLVVYPPKRIVLVADRQISFSGERIAEAEGVLSSVSQVEARLSDTADSELIRLSSEGTIISSSDVVIVKKSRSILDLPKHVFVNRRIYGKNVIDMNYIIASLGMLTFSPL
ncbi:MAG: hypothetical protein GU347_06175 [Desulfurococcales archaeon]|nr:hypothetical protein [Desulfurococcales archaeon]